MTGKADVFLGLGGNIGEPEKAMAAALKALDERGDIALVAVSSLYCTPPWGKTDQPDFLNAVAHVQTNLAPHDLLAICLDIERSLKRVRKERWGPRAIDIDILVFGTREIAEEGLSIPHPRMLQRAFVLAPFAEIAPDFMLNARMIKDHLSALDTEGMTIAAPQGWWRS